MPEAPDLEVIVEFIADRAVGAKIQSAAIIKPSVLRSLCGDLASDILGRTLNHIERRGKFMLLRLSGDRVLAVNPMLTGALQYCPRGQRGFKRTCVRLSLSNGQELRYLDDRQMGSVYYVSEDWLNQVPRLMEQGPDVLSDISFEDFQRSLRPFHGEIKGILTRGRVISGIGNAYSDEILFDAGIYPFRKRKALSDGELRRVYESSRGVVWGGTGGDPDLEEAHGRKHPHQGPGLPQGAQQGRNPLPPLRKGHQPGDRQQAHYQLL